MFSVGLIPVENITDIYNSFFIKMKDLESIIHENSNSIGEIQNTFKVNGQAIFSLSNDIETLKESALIFERKIKQLIKHMVKHGLNEEEDETATAIPVEDEDE